VARPYDVQTRCCGAGDSLAGAAFTTPGA
jgi:hypothetical protein